MPRPLDKPPSGQTFDWRVFKDWFFRLWKYVTGGVFGTGTGADSGYGSTIALASALLGTEHSGPPAWSNIGWSYYTPTLTANSGSYGSWSTTGQFCILGNLVIFGCSATITAVGTGTNPIFSLPVPCAQLNVFMIANGREAGITGDSLNGGIGGTTVGPMFTYNNGNPAATGAIVIVSGFYVKA